MLTVTVSLGARSYPVLIGSGLLGSAALMRAQVPQRDVLLVSNSVVAPLYVPLLQQHLPVRRLVQVILPDGEQHKTLETASRVFDVLIANRFGRDTLVIALGGGVVGDLAGFVAACYQRGVDWIQVPTTLLAQVDSSVGGKTAVNHPGGKNLIGAFHQPHAVLTDTEVLRTLPDRELHAGLAEVIKYGLIYDAAFFEWLERHLEALLAREPEALMHAIGRSCEIKAEIVARDEREQAERAWLNLGHTFGHAIEAATGYVEWLHGEAIGTGMLIAADLSARLGRLDGATVSRLRSLLERAGLPIAAPRIGAARALDYMRVDKKVQSGRVRLVLLEGLGRAVITGEYPDAALQATLSSPFRMSGEVLAAYAAQDLRSRGRRYAESPPQYRSEFQRDRDRIIHSNAFRRLAYKTQVFVNHEGDLYRTRVTHSIEVGQIARTIARALALNETLTEAISLAHDLGHTPFGHAGQDALNGCMRDYGGFEHNLQSLRTVDELEERYALFPGLNLTFECREGILKHCSLSKARELGELGERFLLRRQPSLEAQLANLADEIAYNHHDVDDGIRAGLITLEEAAEMPLVGRQFSEVLRLYPDLQGRRRVHETVRRMVNEVVIDVIQTSVEQLREAAPADIEAVRSHERALIGMSISMQGQHLELKQFLRERVYRHQRVLRMTTKARRVVEELFRAFLDTIELLPAEYCESARRAEQRDGTAGRARTVADYIAGMTDRYAILEHRRLFDPAERT